MLKIIYILLACLCVSVQANLRGRRLVNSLIKNESDTLNKTEYDE